MVPYADAAPDSAFVLPSKISVLVIPTSVWTVGAGEPPQAATAMKRAAIAAIRDPVFAIELPPVLMKMYLNSLLFATQSGDRAVSVQSPDRRPPLGACAVGRSRR